MKEITSTSDLVDFTGLVLFSAPWCAPCKQYRPHLVKFAVENKIALATVDVDAHRAIGQQYGVRAVPTTFYFKDGVPSGVRSGALTEAVLKGLCIAGEAQ